MRLPVAAKMALATAGAMPIVPGSPMPPGASPFFTSVIGNEVTTANGHFNAFPFKLETGRPNYKETIWVKLVADIRSRGAQYVILNHPRWPAITNSPLSFWGLNRADGSRTNKSVEFTMDAIELQNSPDTTAYIIIYAGRTSRTGQADKLGRRSLDYLTIQRGIDSQRLVVTNGGYRDSDSIEIWICPQGAKPPQPTPTVQPSEVQPAPERTRPRRPRRGE